MPRANKIGLLTNPEDPKAPPQLKELDAACRTPDLKIVAANGTPRDEVIE
jgi:ABC-type uncharacterized transport system substrate-binding protein